MNYSREKLNSLYQTKNKPAEFDEITQTLANKVVANEEISLSEEQFICGILENARNEKGERNINIQLYDSCKNYLFRNRYMLYFNDLNGHKKIFDHLSELSIDRKRKDVAFLQKEYENWHTFISGKTNGTELINYISQETNNQLKKLDEYCAKLLIGNKELLKEISGFTRKIHLFIS